MAFSNTAKFNLEGGQYEKRRSLPLTRNDTFFSKYVFVRTKKKIFRKEYYMKKYLVIGLALLLIAGFAFAGGSQPKTPPGKVVNVFGVFRPPSNPLRFARASMSGTSTHRSSKPLSSSASKAGTRRTSRLCLSPA
jgi:hypothetical protein